MVYTCSVPGCRGNYDKENKVHVFSFPADDNLKQKWLRAIPRENFNVTKNSKVCERHFKEGEVLFRTSFYNEKTGETLSAPLKKPKLKENTVPSIFIGCPSYLSSSSTSIRESPTKKRQRIENDQVALAVAESLNSQNEYDRKYKFTNFDELQSCLQNHNISKHWTVVVKEGVMLFIDINLHNDIPQLQYAVSINLDLNLNVSFKGEKLLKHKSSLLPFKVGSINDILKVLDFYESTDPLSSANPLNAKVNIIESILKDSENLFSDSNKLFFKFFLEQLKLIPCKPERYRYSPDLLIFASLLFYISPQAYKFIRTSQYLILPGPSTIRKIGAMLRNSPQEEEHKNFLSYAKHAFLKLENYDHDVFLMIDEIHIKPFLDFKGGNIVGTAYNSTDLATSVHVFMVGSLFSPYKDVVHIVPVHSFDASKLYNLLDKVVMGLEDIGFKVNGLVADNNSINRKAVSYFADPPQLLVKYIHPKDSSRPLFFVIDSVHIFKCFRNNWMNNHKNGYYFYFPSFTSSDETNPLIMTASLTSVRKLYDLECTNILKFGYGLTRKALWPSNLERQNVKLAQKLFSTNVVVALKELGEKYNLEHYEQTSEFINLICTWWDVVNVKTPNKGKVKRNSMCEPITSSPSDERLSFLKQFVSWLTRWENLKSNNGRLSKETFLAARHTTEAFIEIVSYFTKNFNKSYVLLGKIQTDKLESRFGQYRSMAGDQYHISVRQIYETESKLRLCHELKLASHTKGDINVDIFHCDETIIDDDKELPVDSIFSGVTVEDNDIKAIEDSLPIITYLAGYCSHAASKKTKCAECRQLLFVDKDLVSENYFNLIEVKDRGGLMFPSEVVINAVIHTYIVVQKLISKKYEETFMKAISQRNVVTNIVEDILVAKDSFLCFDTCLKGHDLLPLIKIILKAATNSLLNNYCKVKNDNLKVKKIPNITVVAKNKRKLETYSKSSIKKTQDEVNM